MVDRTSLAYAHTLWALRKHECSCSHRAYRKLGRKRRDRRFLLLDQVLVLLPLRGKKQHLAQRLVKIRRQAPHQLLLQLRAPVLHRRARLNVLECKLAPSTIAITTTTTIITIIIVTVIIMIIMTMIIIIIIMVINNNNNDNNNNNNNDDNDNNNNDAAAFLQPESLEGFSQRLPSMTYFVLQCISSLDRTSS